MKMNMKPINLLHNNSNPRVKILIKERNINKFQFIPNLNDKKKNPLNLFNSNSNSKTKYNFAKKNNYTINNSINNIINNITINNNSKNGSKNNIHVKQNNSLSKTKEKNIYQSYMDKKNNKGDIIFKKPINISRNDYNSFSNNSNQSFNYLSLGGKIKKNPSFQNNKIKLINYKIFWRVPNNNDLNLKNINNNIYNTKASCNNVYNITNNSINENNKKLKKNSSTNSTNQSINFTKNSFYKKKNSLNKKENKDKIIDNVNNIKINNKYCNIKNKFNNRNNIKNNNNISNQNSLNNKFYGDYILNRMIQKKIEKKNKSINLKKFPSMANNQSLINNFNNNNNHTNANTNNNTQINKYINNYLERNKPININIKIENINNKIHNSNYDIDDIENNKIFIGDAQETKNKVFEKKNEKMKYTDSSLDETIKFSKCSSKVEEEGELGLDEVKDIIIYYNLNNDIRSKNYMFKKNDYNDFIEKGKYKYLNFFMK